MFELKFLANFGLLHSILKTDQMSLEISPNDCDRLGFFSQPIGFLSQLGLSHPSLKCQSRIRCRLKGHKWCSSMKYSIFAFLKELGACIDHWHSSNFIRLLQSYNHVILLSASLEFGVIRKDILCAFSWGRVKRRNSNGFRHDIEIRGDRRSAPRFPWAHYFRPFLQLAMTH